MKNILKNINSTDIVALVIIIGGIILKLKGADGTVGLLLTTVAFYYFGKKGVEMKKCEDAEKTNDQLQTK